jgi:hypothetical protein
MTRHKSRVARIRRARRGTRKQSGGMFGFLNPFNWFKKTDPAAVPAAGAPVPAAGAPTVPESNKGFFNKPPTDQTQLPPAAPQPPTQLPSPQTQPPPAVPVPQGGGRKTRHRRRSPRHHRK